MRRDDGFRRRLMEWLIERLEEAEDNRHQAQEAGVNAKPSRMYWSGYCQALVDMRAEVEEL